MLTASKEQPLGNSISTLYEEVVKTDISDASTGPSVWGNLGKDLELFSLPHKSERGKRLDLIVTDSHIPDVSRHQLAILVGEYPSISLQKSLLCWISSMSTGLPLEHIYMVDLMVLLDDLRSIESAHASGVFACRARDGIKGRTIIPDYDAVNAAGADTMSDTVVKRAFERSNQIADAIIKIPLLDWTKFSSSV